MPFKGNIPGNIDLRVLDDILYTERDMPGSPVSEEERKAIEAARSFRRQQEEALYLKKLEAKVLQDPSPMQKDDASLDQQASESPITQAPQAVRGESATTTSEPSVATIEPSAVKPIKRDLHAPRM